LTGNISLLAEMNAALTSGLGAYAAMQLEAAFGGAWRERARLPARCGAGPLDAHAALYAIIHNWNDAFRHALPAGVRSAASSALDGRNAMSHPHSTPSDDLTLRSLLAACEILSAVGAKKELTILERLRDKKLGGYRGGDAGSKKTAAVRPPNRAASAASGMRESMSGNAGDFWVYENWTHKYAKAHHSACSYCNGGAGLHADSSNRNGHWLGPFSSKEQALTAARATGQPKTGFCAICDK